MAEYHVIRMDEVDSTNSEIKRRAAELADKTVLIAGRQTGGRGRLGRSFFSPVGGLYMSVLLREAAKSEALPLLTIAAAVAVAEAAEELCHRPLSVKWVNDVYLDGRKVCGILTEAMTDGAAGVQCAVVGIGVNLALSSDLPQEVRARAGALFTPDTLPLNATDTLAAGILDRLLPYADALPGRGYLAGYRARDMLCERAVSFCENGVWRQGVACGIDDNGGLRVRMSDGGTRTLHSGEVTMHK